MKLLILASLLLGTMAHAGNSQIGSSTETQGEPLPNGSNRSIERSFQCQNKEFSAKIEYSMGAIADSIVRGSLKKNNKEIANSFVANDNITAALISDEGDVEHYGSVLPPDRFAAFDKTIYPDGSSKLYEIIVSGHDYTVATAEVKANGKKVGQLNCKVSDETDLSQ